MDLAKIAVEPKRWDDPIESRLFDEHGNPELDSAGHPVVLLVVSDYAQPVRRLEAQHKQTIAQLVRRYDGFGNIPSNELEVLRVARIAAHIVGWRGLDQSGEVLAYTPERAVLVTRGLLTHRPKQLAQVEDDIAQHAKLVAKSAV